MQPMKVKREDHNEQAWEQEQEPARETFFWHMQVAVLAG